MQFLPDRISITLLGMCLVLSFLIIINLFVDFLPRPIGGQEARAIPGIAPSSLQQVSHEQRPLMDFDVFSTHTLFNKSRNPGIKQPQQVLEDQAAVAVQPFTGFILAGIILAADKNSALLAPQDSSEFLHISTGDVVKGWAVQEIRSDCVIFVNGELVSELSFPVKQPGTQ